MNQFAGSLEGPALTDASPASSGFLLEKIERTREGTINTAHKVKDTSH